MSNKQKQVISGFVVFVCLVCGPIFGLIVNNFSRMNCEVPSGLWLNADKCIEMADKMRLWYAAGATGFCCFGGFMVLLVFWILLSGKTRS
ncbi:hypothetical protein A2264_00800 [candidate division WWE3 bacterium RIFOXYA2_FULL_46_9]|uniref:Uncharacterized protein n=1 Tax=candidate division WWE3 bacterium RIFOXYA2_FULL_46_9 TaxID=1802636 RepID=A0A1F4W2D2_UNCKA|nr:MAG: hypothetical protein A2264_00800 [candidate division WWE3 bacterium RIFOXYA2_FULL_46_9]OGC65294.1 MAG: hypothetical protein A2326_04430 [candidate division WWE3 bacterium RIFOXYB2_FULL_41_6]HLD51402.1 hypothetical protein [Patescibacteria group bacterium]